MAKFVVSVNDRAGHYSSLAIVMVSADGSAGHARAAVFDVLPEGGIAYDFMQSPKETIDEFLQGMVECAYKRGILPADLGKAIQPMIQWTPADPRDALVTALKAHIADLRAMLFGDGMVTLPATDMEALRASGAPEIRK